MAPVITIRSFDNDNHSMTSFTLSIPELAALLVATFVLGAAFYALFRSLARWVSKRIIKIEETGQVVDRSMSVPPRYSRIERDSVCPTESNPDYPQDKDIDGLVESEAFDGHVQDSEGVPVVVCDVEYEDYEEVLLRPQVVDHDTSTPCAPLPEPSLSVLSPFKEVSSLEISTYPSVASIQERLAVWQVWHNSRASLAGNLDSQDDISDSSSILSESSSLSTVMPSSPKYTVPDRYFSSLMISSEGQQTPRRVPFADLSSSHNQETELSDQASPHNFESTPKKPLHRYRSWMDSYKEHNGLSGSRTKVEGEINKPAPRRNTQKKRTRALTDLVKSLGGNEDRVDVHVDGVGEGVTTPAKKIYPMGSYWSPEY